MSGRSYGQILTLFLKFLRYLCCLPRCSLKRAGPHVFLLYELNGWDQVRPAPCMLKFHLGPKCIYSTMTAYQGRTCSPGRTLPKGTSIRVYYQCRQLAKKFLLCAFFQKLVLHLGKQPYKICRILRKSFKKENKIDWLILLPRTRLIEIQDLSRDTVPLRLNRKYNHPSTVQYSTCGGREIGDMKTRHTALLMVLGSNRASPWMV